jgi:hypothetical protein
MWLHDLFYYHPESLWILIPLVAIVGGFVTQWHNANIKADVARAGSAEAMQDVLDAIRRLEQRVGNLERAAMTVETERKYRVL